MHAGKYFYARPTKTKVGGGWTRLEECGGGGCDVGVVELREKLFNALGDDRCEIYHLRVPPPPRLLLSTTPPRSLLCLCPLFCWGVCDPALPPKNARGGSEFRFHAGPVHSLAARILLRVRRREEARDVSIARRADLPRLALVCVLAVAAST